jgi:hypothetical protein
MGDTNLDPFPDKGASIAPAIALCRNRNGFDVEEDLKNTIHDFLDILQRMFAF